MKKVKIKSKRRFMSLILMCLLTFIQMQALDARGILVEVEKPRVGIVTKIIDAEAVEVMYYSTSSSITVTEKLKIVGVNSSAYKESLEFTKNQLLGKTVFVVYDTQLEADVDGFIPAYIYINTDQSFNETLLQYGYGVFDTKDENASYKIDLLKAEQIAKRHELNVWKTQSTPINIININLASLETLMDHFGLNATQATAIITYRKYNSINSRDELGFILPEFTRDFLSHEGRSVHYVTDLNRASLYELKSLFSTFSSLDLAFMLNDYRIFQPIASLTSIKSLLSLSHSDYIKLEQFSTTIPNNTLYTEPNKKKANINTATVAEIMDVSTLNLSQANFLVNLRKSVSFTYRSLEEIYRYDVNTFPNGLTYYMDDLSTLTNVNTATLEELKSLFSTSLTKDADKLRLAKRIMDFRPFYNYSRLEQTVGFTFYNYIKPYIYLDEIPKSEIAPININTATKGKVISYLGLSSSNATKLQSRNSSFRRLNEVFFMNETNASKIALYTNINSANLAELLLLHHTMTEALAKKIIEHRIEFPFYRLNDVASFLEAEKRSDLYVILKDYIVFY